MSKKKKILIITLAWAPVESGGEIAPRKIAEMLTRNPSEQKSPLGKVLGSPRPTAGPDHFLKDFSAPRDYEFDVLCYRFAPEHLKTEKASHGTIYRVGGYGHGHLCKNLWTLQAGIKALALQRKNKYDAVWVVMAAYGAGAAMIFNFFSPRVPILLTLQEGDPLEHIYRRLGILRPLWHLFFRRVIAVTAISNYLAGVAKTCGFRGTPVVVPNGTGVPEYLGIKNQELRIKKEIILVSNSRLEKKNGLDIVIAALPLLPDNFVFKNVGEGSLREELRIKSRELRLEHRVTLDNGVNSEEAIEYLKQGDIFVRPSRSEGLGASFLEAMALGIPIIATPVGGIPDFLKDGQTGLMCEPESPESFAEAVMKYVSSPEMYEKVRNNAYELAKKEYSWQSVGARMRKVFDSL